jgi:hypothetical protein
MGAHLTGISGSKGSREDNYFTSSKGSNTVLKLEDGVDNE